ncbi:hypothetical protein AB0M02_39510 [Actinoplanes sp. NPDC051861]|uniref:hypothetical protein n=1 Tax=Actinoplanes sp. NPDC051861 TaxID=3155170 RepID=UPI0034142ED7
MVKGSRLITVDGLAYRWRVRRRPTHSQALAWAPLSFAVERADRHGCVLIATMPGAHPRNWRGTGSAAVLPSIVATVIRQARERGWHPDSPGPAFRLAVSPEIWAETARN